MMSLLCIAFLSCLTGTFTLNQENKESCVYKAWGFLFVFLLRAENLPDLRKEVGAQCAVWLFSGGIVRWSFCWDQPLLRPSAMRTGSHPWGSAGCWTPAAPPAARKDRGKSEEAKSWGWDESLCCTIVYFFKWWRLHHFKFSLWLIINALQVKWMTFDISQTDFVWYVLNCKPLPLLSFFLSSLPVCPAVWSCPQGQSRVMM